METKESKSESTSHARDLGTVTERRDDQQDVIHGAVARPSNPQRRYLEHGFDQPGGKLPLFDRDGRQIPRKTIESCIVNGWAEHWTPNPIKPDWLVCRLTAAG